MAEKLNPNVLYVREPLESVSSLDSDRLTQPDAGEESSDSDGEQEISHKLIRKVSTSGQIRAKVDLRNFVNVLSIR
ncbi:Diacylglycerol kinase eta [Acipenser ruthenus]|uniref:Diacylglycerol kinase eta n=1 Tax=Acipenser ruthenus TaxID=7906 RepID=A0A444V065_ACIRT|nr:Diacylglycerol kinase eta [Acipenser ruthenus]